MTLAALQADYLGRNGSSDTEIQYTIQFEARGGQENKAFFANPLESQSVESCIRGALFLKGAYTVHAATLLEIFSHLDDPRCRRGVRHPFDGIVVLMLLGMLALIREMEVLVRWATVHWDQLKGAQGFDRDNPPCATTIY